VCERNPVLAIARKDKNKERCDERNARTGGPYLFEHPPGCNAKDKTDDQRKDLPIHRHRRDEACGEIKNGTKKWAKRRKGWVKLAGTEEACNPGEGPIIPVKAGKWQ